TRTVISFFNMDNANIIYVSDEAGQAIADMIPVFPETFISLERVNGEEPQKAWYGRTAVQSDLRVLESYGCIPSDPGVPQEPNPQEPYSPIDAPLMRSWQR
ncbi:unnamed protein product, partial [marine sediment metagenome]